MVMPAARSISSWASAKGRPSRCARRRPIVDLPAPISPTRTTGRVRIAAGMADARLFGFRRMVRAAIPPEARGALVFGAKGEPRGVGILRTRASSGKGRWVGRVVVGRKSVVEGRGGVGGVENGGGRII